MIRPALGGIISHRRAPGRRAQLTNPWATLFDAVARQVHPMFADLCRNYPMKTSRLERRVRWHGKPVRAIHPLL